MPDDFIPTGRKLKVTHDDKTPLADRFQCISALDRRSGAAFGTSTPGISIEEFEKRLQSLRVATDQWGKARLKAALVEKLNSVYPHLQVGGSYLFAS